MGGNGRGRRGRVIIRQRCDGERHQQDQNGGTEPAHQRASCFAGSPARAVFACWGALAEGWAAATFVCSTPGGGSSGGRSWPCAIFCTSISEKTMAGAAAATGTEPDSAP